MTLRKTDFGKMLQSKLEKTSDIVALSRWAYRTYLENIRGLEPGLEAVLLDIARMEEAPEFEYSYEDLAQLAIALKSGGEIL